MKKIIIFFMLAGGVCLGIFSVIIFFKPTQDLMGVARNNSSVAHYPKLGSLMDFSVLLILLAGFVVVGIVAWKKRKTG